MDTACHLSSEVHPIQLQFRNGHRFLLYSTRRIVQIRITIEEETS